MRVPIEWLRSYCAPEGLIDDPRALAVKLTMTGTEVERIGHAGAPDPANFVIGKVLTADKHPDADRLSVCTVDDVGWTVLIAESSGRPSRSRCRPPRCRTAP